MKFEVGHDLSVQGVRYRILGSILYKDRQQNDTWEEYRLRNCENRTESWLSYDEGNQEYEMSFMCNTSSPPEGFKLVDSGTQVVCGRYGSVDVDMGETAQYETWEDATEEHTYSVERWSDGPEYSRGMYVELESIQDLGPSPEAQKEKKKENATVWIILAAAAAFVAGLVALGSSSSKGETHIRNMLLGLPETYVVVEESGSGDDESEKVTTFGTNQSVDATAKDIITRLEGEVSSVREDEDGKTVALLTPNEYILVYEAADEDGLTSESESAEATGSDTVSGGTTVGTPIDQAMAVDESATTDEATTEEQNDQATTTDTADGYNTYVQVASRRHAYTTDERPYRASYRAYRWYRQFYYAQAFANDAKSYKDDDSSYSNYTGATALDSSSTSAYESYASSIRQESAAKKQSDGGGTSSGK